MYTAATTTAAIILTTKARNYYDKYMLSLALGEERDTNVTLSSLADIIRAHKSALSGRIEPPVFPEIIKKAIPMQLNHLSLPSENIQVIRQTSGHGLDSKGWEPYYDYIEPALGEELRCWGAECSYCCVSLGIYQLRFSQAHQLFLLCCL